MKLTVEINLELHELKKAFARFHGERDWCKVRKADIAAWVGSLAEADIEGDLDDALNDFDPENIYGVLEQPDSPSLDSSIPAP